MSYSAYEYSAEDARPVFRVLFVTGDIEYAFTTESNIVADSYRTFTPAPIVLSDINQTNEMSKDPLKIEFPRDNQFAQNFLGGVPEQITTVTVFRGHVGDVDEDFQFYWKGRVAGASATGDTVEINCENIFTSMRRPGLRARYQKTCRHPLYSSGCGLNDYDFANIVTVTGVSGTTVTLDNLDSSASDDDWFTGGTLETDAGEMRYITKHQGLTLTLMYALPSLSEEVNDGSAGQTTVTLYPGCDHTLATCVSKFANEENFGGFQAMPGKNPFRNAIEGSIA